MFFSHNFVSLRPPGRLVRTSLILLATLLLFSCSKPGDLIIQGTTMGTLYHIKIADRALQTPSLLQSRIDSLLKEINRQMSTYIPGSEISRFNRLHSDRPYPVSPQFMEVLKLSLQINRESHGAFDVTVGPLVDLWGFGKKGERQSPPPEDQIEQIRSRVGSQFIHILNDSMISKSNPESELDFSAVAKGYGVDEVTRFLSQLGYKNFIVEIGGEVEVRGFHFNNPWKIGIDRPQIGNQPGEKLEAILKLSNIAVATSGDYRNYFISGHHLYSHEINPATGYPIDNGVASVTIIAPSCALADAMATAIMVMGGKSGLAWVESKPKVETLIIVHRKEGFKEMMSSGFKTFLKKSTH